LLYAKLKQRDFFYDEDTDFSQYAFFRVYVYNDKAQLMAKGAGDQQGLALPGDNGEPRRTITLASESLVTPFPPGNYKIYILRSKNKEDDLKTYGGQVRVTCDPYK